MSALFLVYPSDSVVGYRIALEKPQVVSIAETKISKAKKRIVLSLKAFIRDGDFEMLIERLRFLSCSTRIRKPQRKVAVYTGYRHVYRLCDEGAILKQLRSLDNFVHGIVNSRRYFLGRSLAKMLTLEQKTVLKAFSFERNYSSNTTLNIPPKKILEIKQAWKYA